MVNRRYLITFRCGTVYESRFTEIKANDKDMAYSTACGKYGFYNVGGVYVDNAVNREYLRFKGFVQMVNL